MRVPVSARVVAAIRRSVAVGALVLAMAAAPEAGAQPGAPLFATHDPLEATLAVPLRTLVRRMSRRPVVDGTFTYAGDQGPVVLDVEVTTRGFSRLEICAFPPLRLDFKRGQLPGTVLAGQNRLKLVTLCRDRPDYAQYLELEYVAYRVYNLVTEYGFRARKVALRYVDTERGDVVEAPAFFLEDIDGVAERLGTRELEVPAVGVAELEPHRLAELGVFQYLIGNTDWSAIAAADGEDCCHNMGVVAPREKTGIVTIPYDFDQTGLVDASYAEPNPALRLRTVRQRLYRGFCIANPHVDAAIQAFNAARADIEALFAAASLDDEHRTEALEYLAEGFAVLNDPALRQREIEAACRD